MTDDVAQAAPAQVGAGPQLSEEHHSWMGDFFGVNTRPDAAAAPPAEKAPEEKKESGGFFSKLSDAASAVGDMASSAVHGVVDAGEKVVSVATDVAGKVLETAVDVQAKVEGAVVDAIPLPDSIKSAAHTAIDFQKGVGEGVIEGAKGAIKGIAHLAGSATKEVYDLATSEKAREEAATTVVHGAEAVGSFVNTAMTDPSKAGEEIEGAVKGAADKVVQIGKAVYHSYEEAKAAGHGAEWLGKGVGQVGVAVAGAVLTDGASLAGEGAVVGAEVVTEGANLVRGAEALEEVAGLAKSAQVLEDTATLGKGAQALEDTAALGKGAQALEDAEALRKGAQALEDTASLGRGAEEVSQGAKAARGAEEVEKVGQTGTQVAKAEEKAAEAEPELAEVGADAKAGAGGSGGEGGGGRSGGGGDEPPSSAGGDEPPESGGGTPPKKAPPEGLKFRDDFEQHLAGPDGWKGGKLHGTHNADNAMSQLEGRGAAKMDALQPGQPGYTLKPTASPGINNLDYQVVNPNTGLLKEGAKTVYDPALYTDEQMAEMSREAGGDAFTRFKANPSIKPDPFDTQVGDVTMRSYINFEPGTGTPIVGNVHPIDPADAEFLLSPPTP